MNGNTLDGTVYCFIVVLVTVLLCEEEIMTKETFIKRSINWELADSFRGLVHYHHGREKAGRC